MINRAGTVPGMGKRITKLEVHEVSLVRRGANPGAKVLLIKSRAGLLDRAKKALGWTTRKALESDEQLDAYGALRAAFIEAAGPAAEAGDAETLKTSVDEFLAGAAALDASAKLPAAETFITGGEDAEKRLAAVAAGVAAVDAALGIEAQLAEPELEEEDMTKPADADGILKQKDVEIAALKAELAKSRKEGEALETRLGELAGRFTAMEQDALRKSLKAEVAGYAHDGLTADETVEALIAPKPEHVRKLLTAATAKSGEMSALFKAHGFRGTPQDAPRPVTKMVAERAETLRKSNPSLPEAVARSQALQSLTAEEREAFNQERA